MKTPPRTWGKLALALACTLPITPLVASVWHVKPDGNDSATGDSWSQARKTITSSIAAAQPGDEIWVSAGVYAEHLELSPGVSLYGGFSGSESSREQRDWIRQLTVLDGTTNGVVVLIAEAGSDTILDDGSNDADQDGASNSHEYWAGTVPHDPASRLALELARDPDTHQFLLRWFGAANRYYLIEYAETLPGPETWPRLAESLPGQNTPMTWTAPAPDNPRFYRVQARLEP